jgi:hypothetical protein
MAAVAIIEGAAIIVKECRTVEENDNIRCSEGKLKWSKVIKQVKEAVIDLIEAADAIKDTEEYQQIQMEEYSLMRKGFSAAEAEYAAWKNRKILVKVALQEALKNIVEEENSVSENEEAPNEELNM